MHKKKNVMKAAGVIPNVQSAQTDSRIRDFVMHPEVIAMEQLQELRRIRELLEKQAKTL